MAAPWAVGLWGEGREWKALLPPRHPGMRPELTYLLAKAPACHPKGGDGEGDAAAMLRHLFSVNMK